MSDKKSFSIEYDFHASKQLLFQYLSTPSGLGEWFADNVNSRGENFSFIWDDSEENAKLIQKKNNERVRFQWEEDEEENNPYYFEFKIQVDDITNDVSLIITRDKSPLGYEALGSSNVPSYTRSTTIS